MGGANKKKSTGGTLLERHFFSYSGVVPAIWIFQRAPYILLRLAGLGPKFDGVDRVCIIALPFTILGTLGNLRQSNFHDSLTFRDQTANIHWLIKKAREFQKNIYFCFIDYTNPLCGSQQTVENS